MLAAVIDFLESDSHSWAFIVVPDQSQVRGLKWLVERQFRKQHHRRVKIYPVESFRTLTPGFAGVGIFIDNIDMMRGDAGLSNILRHSVFPVILVTHTGPERFWNDEEDSPPAINYDLVCIWCGEELPTLEELTAHEESHD